MTACHARITGRVQGVAFRAWLQAEAQARGLAGWVRNEADGAVSAHIEGPSDALREILDALHEGPPMARVAHIEAASTPPEGLQGFEIRR
jgi:acylphosphatase